MHRRTYLAAGAGGLAATAGCLTSVLGTSEGAGPTVLSPPSDTRYDSDDLPYPAHGQALPEVSVPDALTGETVDTAALDETLVVTAFFASCPAECLLLVGQLASVQQATLDRGLSEEVTFLAITFDPARDDAAALRDYADKMNVDVEAGNWRFLRPESEARAETVVDDKLGVTFDRIGGESARVEGYDFRHLSLTFLVNPSGIVERAYRTDRPDVDRVVSDVATVVEGPT